MDITHGGHYLDEDHWKEISISLKILQRTVNPLETLLLPTAKSTKSLLNNDLDHLLLILDNRTSIYVVENSYFVNENCNYANERSKFNVGKEEYDITFQVRLW